MDMDDKSLCPDKQYDLNLSVYTFVPNNYRGHIVTKILHKTPETYKQ